VTVTGVTLDNPDPVAAITQYAEQLDPGLVVLGTRALGRPTHPALGSVASAVTRRLAMPVLLVPPAVWREYARDLVA
jgi:nucleotide-binding universal stress UspA family protein